MNKYEKRSATHYDREAANYDDTPEGRFTCRFNAMIAHAVRLPENGRLLDVACGSGRLLKMLRQTRVFEGYGVDISGEMIKAAAKGSPGTVFKKAPCDGLPFEDSFFDALTVSAAYHHFPDGREFAKEAFRVLKPYGGLYIADICYPAFWRVILNPFIRFSPAGDVRFHSPGAITSLLRGEGFQCEPVRIEGYIQLIIAHK